MGHVTPDEEPEFGPCDDCLTDMPAVIHCVMDAGILGILEGDLNWSEPGSWVGEIFGPGDFYTVQTDFCIGVTKDLHFITEGVLFNVCGWKINVAEGCWPFATGTTTLDCDFELSIG